MWVTGYSFTSNCKLDYYFSITGLYEIIFAMFSRLTAITVVIEFPSENTKLILFRISLYCFD